MPTPYLITILLFGLVAAFFAADASLVSLGLLGAMPGTGWLRIHFITLGILAQLMFALLPTLAASIARKPRPAMRWDIWLLLNAGLVALAFGFWSGTSILILAGGALVFLAAILFILQLWGLRSDGASPSLRFYVTGVLFLLVGILIGTGLGTDWSPILRIHDPLETHVHATIWGFMSLAFAGLLLDLVPTITGKLLVSERALPVLYAAMSLSALALVLGPWLGLAPLLGAGLVIHTLAVGWLLHRMLHAFKDAEKLGSPGAWHILFGYAWTLLPLLTAPFIQLKVLDGSALSALAPQALVYGWLMQLTVALLPYAANRFFLKRDGAALGGSWGSLAAATAGSLQLWISIFAAPVRGLLYGLAYAAYALSLITPLRQLVALLRQPAPKTDGTHPSITA